MDKSQIKITINGLPKDQGYVRVNALMTAVSNFVKNINRMDKIVTKSGRPSFYLRIVDMSYASPANLVMEPIPEDPKKDYGLEVTTKVFDMYNSVREGTFEKQDFEYGLIEDMVAITDLIEKQVESINFHVNGRGVEINAQFKNSINVALAKDITYVGFIRGDLEYINIHGGQNVFRIYPPIGPSKVTCHFPEDLKETAIKAVGRFIEVHGVLHYKKMSRFPYQIVVKDMDILPLEDELPTFDDLLGIVPNLTEGMASEDYVRKIRNEQKS